MERFYYIVAHDENNKPLVGKWTAGRNEDDAKLNFEFYALCHIPTLDTRNLKITNIREE